MLATPKMAFLAGIAALAMGGCSYKLAVRPPHPSEWPTSPESGTIPERCTTSFLPPALDTVVAVILLGVTYVERNAQSRAAPLILAVASVPVAVSAGYGYGVAIQCRRYQSRFPPSR